MLRSSLFNLELEMLVRKFLALTLAVLFFFVKCQLLFFVCFLAMNWVDKVVVVVAAGGIVVFCETLLYRKKFGLFSWSFWPCCCCCCYCWLPWKTFIVRWSQSGNQVLQDIPLAAVFDSFLPLDLILSISLSALKLCVPIFVLPITFY